MKKKQKIVQHLTTNSIIKLNSAIVCSLLNNLINSYKFLSINLIKL